MSVKIRLSRIGKKHAPFYRIVAIDSRRKRDGAFLANLGTYDALKGSVVTLDETGLNHWMSVGAQPSVTVKRIVKGFKKDQSVAAQEPAAKPVKKARASKKKTETVES